MGQIYGSRFIFLVSKIIEKKINGGIDYNGCNDCSEEDNKNYIWQQTFTFAAFLFCYMSELAILRIVTVTKDFYIILYLSGLLVMACICVLPDLYV